MRRFPCPAGCLPILFALLCSGWASFAVGSDPVPAKARAGELIVQYRPGAAPAAPVSLAGDRPTSALAFRPAALLAGAARPAGLKRTEARLGLREGRPLALPRPASALTGAWLLRFDPAADPSALARELQADPGVLYAEPNYEGALCFVPTDPLYPQTQADLAQIGLEAAWDAQPGCSPAVVVAVVDSGVDALHADLQGALDLAGSYNFVSNNTAIYDDLGHGTRVAGLIGAVAGNGQGMAGVAFGAKLLSLDVADAKGMVTAADMASAIDWAVARKARIINLGTSFRAKSQALENACQAAESAGALLVAPAGNEGQGDSPAYPASFDSVLGVGAVGDDGLTRAPWSNYNGLEKSLVELAAPGVTIFSTIPGSQYNGSYGSGTSFAAPLVSGVAALLMAHYPEQSARAIRAQLRQTAHALGDWAGAGRLDAGAALQTALAPELDVQSLTVDDRPTSGTVNNGNGRLEAGETVDLRVRLASSAADVSGLQVALKSSDPEIQAPTEPVRLGLLTSGEGVSETTSNTAVFRGVRYVTATPASKDVSLTLELTGNGGAWSRVLVAKIRTENIYTPPAIIAADTTWTADKSYLVTGNAVVMDNAKLTIEPGTTVRFGPAGKLEVRGSLDASGTAAAPITCTSVADVPSGGFDGFFYRLTPDAIPQNALVGDVDNDGRNEVVITCYDDVVVYRWDGTAFQSLIKFSIGNLWYAQLFITDVDNDGKNELLIWQNSDMNLSILKWDGKKFVTSLKVPMGATPSILRMADVNNDHKNDLVYAIDGAVMMRTGNGSGFGPAVVIATGNVVQDFRIADIDHDGINDLFVTRYNDNTVSYLRGNGTGFDALVHYPVGLVPGRLSIGDIDQDGDNDVVCSSFSYSSIYLLRWNGTGFDNVIQQSVGSQPTAADVVDLFETGKNVVICTTYGPGARLSILKWDGSGFKTFISMQGDKDMTSPAVGDFNNDGHKDILVHINTLPLVDLFTFNPQLAQQRTYPGLWLRSTAKLAKLAHCNFRFAPVADDSSVAAFSDCLFDRTGEATSLVSTAGSTPLSRCTASGNDGGGGIQAGNKELAQCAAQACLGTGLAGGKLTRCVASANRGAAAMSGASATDCKAFDNAATGIAVTGNASGCLVYRNGDWGVDAQGSVDNILASQNGKGISAANISASVARDNTSVGLQASGTASSCLAERNGDAGVTGNNLTDCAVVANARGLAISGTALRCTVAQNGSDGISGGTVTASTVHHNSGAGLAAPGAVANSWVVGNAKQGIVSAASISKSWIAANGSTGVVGKVKPNYTAITASTVRDNAGVGLQSSGAVSGSNLYGNGGGYDYQEGRPSSELQQVNLAGNYWGPETTPVMQANPWGTYFNIARILDFVDDTNLCEVNYSGPLDAPAAGAGPDEQAPAFLLAVTPNLNEPANIGLVTFTLTFSKPMSFYQSAGMAVTFGTEAPFTAHVIEPKDGVGWVDATTWQGTFAVQGGAGEGVNTLRVCGAMAKDNYRIPDDTAQQFLIDTSGGLDVNSGMSTGSGTRLTLEWSEKGKPAGALGFNVERSATGAPGSYVKVNGAPLTAPRFVDEGLAPHTTYTYLIFLIDAQHNATQWTAPFTGQTAGPENGVENWSHYR